MEKRSGGLEAAALESFVGKWESLTPFGDDDDDDDDDVRLRPTAPSFSFLMIVASTLLLTAIAMSRSCVLCYSNPDQQESTV